MGLDKVILVILYLGAQQKSQFQFYKKIDLSDYNLSPSNYSNGNIRINSLIISNNKSHTNKSMIPLIIEGK